MSEFPSAGFGFAGEKSDFRIEEALVAIAVRGVVSFIGFFQRADGVAELQQGVAGEDAEGGIAGVGFVEFVEALVGVGVFAAFDELDDFIDRFAVVFGEKANGFGEAVEAKVEGDGLGGGGCPKRNEDQDVLYCFHMSTLGTYLGCGLDA